MSREETKQLIIKIASAYPTFKPADPTGTINTWYSMLKNVPFEAAVNRLDEHIATNSFPPAIADILNNKKMNEFHNFSERSYDYDELLKDLNRRQKND